MSKIVRAAVIAVLVIAPAFGAADAAPTALADGIGWDQTPTAAAAVGVPVTSAVTPPQTDGIGWD
ncbi:hypothetical protein [Streptomyces camelliae]|uniref:Uncharacterized protein n=1 Tax=Streptomyces camelliae TaxID=3004093 RepID=A0ABY7PGL3_9ACTN|nr:hypothetical protein [Streptomyces sp. HUAS 2-6]WBO69547.1 hypothetical protein O1G22_43105 [Streptomyces sp. HUAS 2-6]